jgi:hypothetical protein
MSCRTLTRIVVFVSLIILIVALAPTALAAPRDPSVSGAVLGSDGVAVPGATIAVNELHKGVFRWVAGLTADADGRWAYTDSPNTYRFDITAANADPESVVLSMAKDGSYSLNPTLPVYGTVAGAISTSPGGAPLAGATVEFYLRNADGTWPSDPYSSAAAAADGTYVSGTLPAGAYAVKAAAPGYVSGFLGGLAIDQATTVNVTRGGTASAVFSLAQPVPPSGSIAGVVVNGAARTPVSGAYVYLYKQNPDGTWPPTSPGWGSPTRTVNTAADGTYNSGSLPLGEYRVRFFDLHMGAQWWQYVGSFDLGTTISLTQDGEAVGGIEGWFGKP